MSSRFVSIWFPHLMTDWMTRRQPALKDIPFALALHEKNRRVVKAVNDHAQKKGVFVNMVVADCKAILPELQVFDFDPEQPSKLLSALGEWCIRYTPLVSVDLPDGLLLDAHGCTHLWGGEEDYLKDIHTRFSGFGYHTQSAMADTIGAAWAVSRFGINASIVKPNMQMEALASLPVAALRLEEPIVDRLNKLGLKTINSFISMPRTALRRRFGQALLTKVGQALGEELELMIPIRPVAAYEERLPSMEPIQTAGGIEIALKTLLEMLCQRLHRENKGLRKCTLRCYRLDGTIQSIEVGTNRPSRNESHLFKLFENKIQDIEPDLGIELFILDAPVVEELLNVQDVLWNSGSAKESAIAELLDRLTGKTGGQAIHRYLPSQHYWPEHSYKEASSVTELPDTSWRKDLPRPLHLLPVPELIEVSVPLPDYPPLLFKYKGVMHTIKKADGPERIEQEWWIKQSLYRDYYCVEDETGARYWLFRLGDYNSGNPEWFIHGFFA